MDDTAKMEQKQAPPPQPRGAGSGAKAVATRERNIIDWPPEPEAHEDAVARLEAEAQANEDYNNEVNKIQTEQIKAMKDTIGFPQGDPQSADDAREEALDAYKAESDPKKKEAALKGEMDARAKRDKEAAAK